jgi:MFS family permease
MYLSPVTTVMKWFPDRRGLATGIALSAFGAGAAIAPTIIHHTMDFFSVAPDFLGSLEDVILETLPDGSQVVAQDSQVGTPGQAVVVATEADTAKHSFVTTGPGVYALGTGNNGTSGAFATLGIGYGIMGALGSRFMSLPHPDWTPDTMQDTSGRKGEEERKATNSENYIGLPVEYVTGSTRQFPLLWLTVFGNATGGLALLSSSKLMLTDIWQGLAPSIVTASFATGYVSSLGVGMALGRFGWSAISDYLGRRNTYMVFGMGIPIVGVAPYFCHVASLTKVEEIAPLLYGFYGGSFLAITFYGGVFSVLPAYIADLFGQKHSGAIHGKALTAWAGSAVAGPMGLAYLRGRSVDHATQDLITKVDDDLVFQHTFGCLPSDREMISRLVDAKTITISRLMEIVPQGTPDPTPFLYDSTCYTAVGLMTLSAFANLFIRPLDVRGILYNLERDTNASTSQSSIAQTNAVKH